MINQTSTKFEEEVEVLENIDIQKNLILYNDDFNTFDHVIDCLIKYCKHDAIQAEQCAYIVHFKGSCVVKTGTINKLQPIKEALLENGLSAVIK